MTSPGRPEFRDGLIGRTLALGFGLLGLGWAVASHVHLPDLGSMRDFSDRVARGDVYPLVVLRARSDRALETGEQTCDATFLAGSLIVAARAADAELSSRDLTLIDRRFAAVGQAARRLVSCVPTQSLGWLALFWSTSAQSGGDPADLRLLAESYRTGPNELWVQLRRSPLAMPLYGSLPEALKARAIDEYLSLATRYQIAAAVQIFGRLDEETRVLVEARMMALPVQRRTLLARHVNRAGHKIDLPTLTGRPDRPWLYQ